MKVWFFALAALITLLDQASKWWMQWTLAPGQSVPIIPGILHLTLTFNTGIAFGLFPQYGRFFLWLSVVVVIVVVLYYLRVPRPGAWTTVIAGLLIGGALGNLWDRVRLGHVVDFIDFRVFPVFNVADTAITVATLLWIVRVWMPLRHDEVAEVSDGRENVAG